MDFYELLEIPRTASLEDIKKSYKKLAREYHPDKTTGDKELEEKFKLITEAYSVLSDPEKRSNYDKYGKDSLNNQGPFQEGFNFMNMNDIFKNMMFDDFPGFQNTQRNVDMIEINIDINDIYYGTTKHVEFEVNDLCGQCKGNGTTDPNGILKCHVCKGAGSSTQQLGPFMMKSTCGSCMGKGQIIKNGKACSMCLGRKTCFVKRKFDLKIPKGVPNNFELRKQNKGAYDESAKRNNDIIFRFIYKIDDNYQISQNGDVTFKVNITIDELLSGFSKHIIIYNDLYKLKSKSYFNPNKKVVIKEKGLKSNSNLILQFNILYTDSSRLEKYADVLRKITNIQLNEKDGEDEYIIQNLL